MAQDRKYKSGVGCAPWCKYAVAQFKLQQCVKDADCTSLAVYKAPTIFCNYMLSVMTDVCDGTSSRLGSYTEFAIQTVTCV